MYFNFLLLPIVTLTIHVGVVVVSVQAFTERYSTLRRNHQQRQSPWLLLLSQQKKGSSELIDWDSSDVREETEKEKIWNGDSNGRLILPSTSTSSPSSSSVSLIHSCSRRQLIRWSRSLALSPFLVPVVVTPPTFSLTDSTTTTTTTTSTTRTASIQNALADLPPIPSNYCRIFFCRHGQTENNRLRLVQGSRINISLNELGHEQGKRIGLALQGVASSSSSSSSPKTLFYTSPLQRAKETAQEAIQQLNNGGNMKNINKIQQLDALKEVDFGPVAEGQPISQVKPGMMATYARWAVGNIDYRPKGIGGSRSDSEDDTSNGESGRDILLRTIEAVNTIIAAAAASAATNNDNKQQPCIIAAFTHSTYLRILLGLFSGDSLANAANFKVENGSINVLDVNLMGQTTSIGSKSKLVGGIFSKAPKDFQLDIPVANIVRINEIRHLEGL